MTCVAQGAAIVSAILQGAPGLDNNAYSVKLEHSLCANPINERRQVYLDPIIKRGVDIPCSYTKTYHPVADPAERVMISVFEGDVYDDPIIPTTSSSPRCRGNSRRPAAARRRHRSRLRVRRRRHPHRPDQRLYANQKKRFAIQQTGADQLDAGQIMKMKRINEDLMKRKRRLRIRRVTATRSNS